MDFEQDFEQFFQIQRLSSLFPYIARKHIFYDCAE